MNLDTKCLCNSNSILYCFFSTWRIINRQKDFIDNGYVKILSKAKRLSFDEDKVGQIQGDKLVYNMESKTWKVLKKSSNDASKIKERVKTILKTRTKK